MQNWLCRYVLCYIRTMLSGASLPCNQVILPEWSDVGYAWKRGVHSECVGRIPRRHFDLLDSSTYFIERMIVKICLWSRFNELLKLKFCRLLITMVEETFDIRRFWEDHGKQIMNQKSGYVEGGNSKWKVKQRKMICDPFLIWYQAQWEDSCWKT